MKRRVYIATSVVVAFLIIADIMLSIKMTNKNTQKRETIGQAEEKQEQSNIQAIEDEPQVPATWDLNRVDPVLSTDNKYVPVPKGFTASGAEGEHTVNTGFVIYEGEVTAANPNEWTEQEAWTASINQNQFVWVPVTNASSRIYERNATTGKLKARLWNYTATGRSAMTNSNTDTKAEPGVSSNQGCDGINYMSDPGYGSMPGYSKDSLYKELETEFKKTMESIEKYGGFYIGRYETGNISQNTPVVRRMNTNISYQNWYKMYSKMRNISTNPNIQTSMIWGCLWDETLQWLVDTRSKTYAEINSSTSWGNYKDSEFTYKTNTSGSTTATKNQNSSTKIPTGSAEYTKANNIYDLAGNLTEWTLESYDPHNRYCRGRSYNVGRHEKSGMLPKLRQCEQGWRQHWRPFTLVRQVKLDKHRRCLQSFIA